MDDQLQRNDLEIEYTAVIAGEAVDAMGTYESVTFEQALEIVRQYTPSLVKRFTWR